MPGRERRWGRGRWADAGSGGARRYRTGTPRPTTGPSQQPRAAPGGCPGSVRRSANRKRGRAGCHSDGSAAATRSAASWRSPAGATNEEAALGMGAAILRGRPEGRGPVRSPRSRERGRSPARTSQRPRAAAGVSHPAGHGCHGRNPGGRGVCASRRPPEVRSRRLRVFPAVFETNYSISREQSNLFNATP